MANTVSHLKHDEGWVLKVLKCDLNFCFTFMCAFYFEFFFYDFLFVSYPGVMGLLMWVCLNKCGECSQLVCG